MKWGVSSGQYCQYASQPSEELGGTGGTPTHNLYGYVPPKGVVILKLLI